MKSWQSLFDPNASFSLDEFLEAHWFIGSNFQANTDKVLKWLDKAMLFESDFFHFERLSPTFPFVSIILNTILFDHAPILFTILFDHAHDMIFTSQFYLNTFFLQQSSM